jgi:hypothetical protein
MWLKAILRLGESVAQEVLLGSAWVVCQRLRPCVDGHALAGKSGALDDGRQTASLAISPRR